MPGIASCSRVCERGGVNCGVLHVRFRRALSSLSMKTPTTMIAIATNRKRIMVWIRSTLLESKIKKTSGAGGRRLHTLDQGRSPMADPHLCGARVLTRFGRTTQVRVGQNEQRLWGCMTGHVHPRRNAAEKSRQTCPPARQFFIASPIEFTTKAPRHQEDFILIFLGVLVPWWFLFTSSDD